MDPFAKLSDAERALLVAAPLPGSVVPMAATLADERFSDPAWVFERELDGIRCIALAGGDDVRLLSRNALPLDGRLPRIAAGLARDPRSPSPSAGRSSRSTARGPASPTPAPARRHLGGAALVAQIGFTEWTRDGRLRHPRFLGLREDKAASEVVRE